MPAKGDLAPVAVRTPLRIVLVYEDGASLELEPGAKFEAETFWIERDRLPEIRKFMAGQGRPGDQQAKRNQ